jgi:inner membrane protease ATP23
MDSSTDSAETELQYKTCIDRLEDTLRTNDSAKKLIAKIQALGCSIPETFLTCKPCDNKDITGGFISNGNTDSSPQIVMCQNSAVSDKMSFQHTVVHELVHAYDHCRAKMDMNNCLHIACTEVRASALSGECTWSHEMLRGHTKFSNGHPECVKRRATLSVEAQSHCKGLGCEAISTVWEKCYEETNPFTDTK